MGLSVLRRSRSPYQPGKHGASRRLYRLDLQEKIELKPVLILEHRSRQQAMHYECFSKALLTCLSLKVRFVTEHYLNS